MRPHAEGKHVTHVLVVPSFVSYMGNNSSNLVSTASACCK